MHLQLLGNIVSMRHATSFCGSPSVAADAIRTTAPCGPLCSRTARAIIRPRMLGRLSGIPFKTGPTVLCLASAFKTSWPWGFRNFGRFGRGTWGGLDGQNSESEGSMEPPICRDLMRMTPEIEPYRSVNRFFALLGRTNLAPRWHLAGFWPYPFWFLRRSSVSR